MYQDFDNLSMQFITGNNKEIPFVSPHNRASHRITVDNRCWIVD